MNTMDIICWAYVAVSALIYLMVLCSLSVLNTKFKIAMLIHAILFVVIGYKLVTTEPTDKPITTKSYKVTV